MQDKGIPSRIHLPNTAEKYYGKFRKDAEEAPILLTFEVTYGIDGMPDQDAIERLRTISLSALNEGLTKSQTSVEVKSINIESAVHQLSPA